jgi:hypothetical protein
MTSPGDSHGNSVRAGFRRWTRWLRELKGPLTRADPSDFVAACIRRHIQSDADVDHPDVPTETRPVDERTVEAPEKEKP